MGSWPWTRAWHCSVLHVAGAGLGWSTVGPTVLLSHDQVLHHQSREWSGVVAGLVRSGWKLMMLVGGQGWSVISNSSVVTWATWDQWYSSSSWLQDHKSWHKVTISASLSSILTEHWNSKMCLFFTLIQSHLEWLFSRNSNQDLDQLCWPWVELSPLTLIWSTILRSVPVSRT